MQDPALLSIITACAAALLFALWWFLGRGRARLPYSKRPALLSSAELRFYRALLEATPPGMAVFVKVRLMDVLSVPEGAWQQHGAPASGMHLDFVLADATTTEAVLVVELDDRSHRRPEARNRDALKDAALAAAGVPLLRVRAARVYDADELRRKVEGAMTGGVNGRS